MVHGAGGFDFGDVPVLEGAAVRDPVRCESCKAQIDTPSGGVRSFIDLHHPIRICAMCAAVSTIYDLLKVARDAERRGFEQGRDAALETYIRLRPISRGRDIADAIRKLEWSDLPDDPKERIAKLREEWEKP